MCYQNGIKSLVFTKKQKLTRKKILFILPSLCAGGAERVISFVAQQVNISKFEAKLIVLGFEKDAVYKIENIEVMYLNKKRLIYAVSDLFYILLKEKPAIVLSTIGHVNIMMGIFSFIFNKIKFVGREASVVSKMSQFGNTKIVIPFFIIRLIYQKLDKIICQSLDMENDFIKNFKISKSKLLVIQNPITIIPKLIHKKNESDLMRFITIGRLSSEKGHLRLLEILATLNNYEFIYTIIGSGPLLYKIKDAIKRLKIQDKVILIPFSKDILEMLNDNDYYLQGSFVEGFPNALLESCTVGTPVIAFNAPGGTKEIIENGINGFIVEDEIEFKSVLFDLEKLKEIDRVNVKNSVIEKFNSSIIIKKYENLFEN